MDRDIKLNFLQIIASPFVMIKDMVTSKSDIEPDRELDIDSTDKTEVELAKSSESIDNKVNAYGNSGKAQRKEVLKSVKVEQKDLTSKGETSRTVQKQPEKQMGEDRSR